MVNLYICAECEKKWKENFIRDIFMIKKSDRLIEGSRRNV